MGDETRSRLSAVSLNPTASEWVPGAGFGAPAPAPAAAGQNGALWPVEWMCVDVVWWSGCVCV